MSFTSSPEELKIPDYVIEETLKPNHSFYKEVTSLEETLPKLDILYMTRVQKERFFNEEDYVRLKDTYILNREKLNLAQPDMPVLHPLPRVDEIPQMWIRIQEPLILTRYKTENISVWHLLWRCLKSRIR